AQMTFKPLPRRPNLAHYDKQAKDLVKSFKSADAATMRMIRQHHPRLPGRPNTNDRNTVTDQEIRRAKLSLADAHAIVAAAHQFESWPQFAHHIRALNQKGSLVSQFEAAVDATVAGDAAALKGSLRENPDLTGCAAGHEERSSFVAKNERITPVIDF